MRKILHIITGLEDGGAEATLFRLCTHDPTHSHVVISLSGIGKYGPKLQAKGIEVHALGMKSDMLSLFAFLKLINLIRTAMPDVLQTWMYHAGLLGSIAARIAGVRPICWGIRNTNFDLNKSKKTTIYVARILGKLSWWLPTYIAICARRGIDEHETLGYNAAIMRFIPNGYDLTEYMPKPAEGRILRDQWGVDFRIPLVGFVGRYAAMKDHANLLRALAILYSRNIRLCCALVGTNMDRDNLDLLEQIRLLGLESSVILLGPKVDIPVVMSAFDIHVLPSAHGEAFPNVVAEAMACMTPCVVTDVGDAAHIVGDTGWVVQPRNAEALANSLQLALEELTQSGWQRRRERARNRIADNFGIDSMVLAYRSLWADALLKCQV